MKDLVYNCFYCMRVLQFCSLERTHKVDNFTLNQWSGLHLPEEGAAAADPAGLSWAATIKTALLTLLWRPAAQLRTPGLGLPLAAGFWLSGGAEASAAVPFASRRCGAGRPRAPPLPWRRERASWRRLGRGAVRGHGAGRPEEGGTGPAQVSAHVWFSRPPL